MKFTTIRIEGAILSADILDKIEQGEIVGQLAKDFGFEPNIKVKDEIVRAWADAQDFWRIFKRHRESVSHDATGATETRRYWILPLLGLLGYEIELTRAEIVNGKSYAISHRARNLEGFPVHIMGFNDSLDKKREDSGPRMSPHALVQEYVNLTEHLYAIVTNGIYLRLLRDSSRLIKFSFIEFDLEAMMEDEHYADFAIMYRLLHSSRIPAKIEAGPESLIEKYHQDALDSGSRIREGLRAAVKFTIESLASSFLKHPANEALRESFQQKALSAYDYYQLLLRLIYRILFLMVIEERDLIYPRNADKTKRDIYYNYYSVNHLRRLCEKGYLEEERYNDLWISLKNSFRLFESEGKGRHLDIKPLAGDLFGYDAIGILNQCHLDNKTILACLKNLSVFINRDTGQKMRVNYASLNTEEFGSVYEGLLEYAPEVIKEEGGYVFIFTRGFERSATGTHYTPDELVQPLIKHSLDYIIAEKLKADDPEKALLSIRVCDVAAGSGHILLNAARRIGAELAKIRTGEDQPSPTAYRAGIRDAIRNCIYGVDKNPLAVELCKVSLWLESHIPGDPLNFLDHHIKWGDSIVGLAHKEELLDGIPTEAFKRLPGDDPDVVKRVAKRNRDDLEQRRQLPLNSAKSLNDNIINIASLLNKLNTMPETTPAEVAAKQKEYQRLTGGSQWWRLKNLADIQVAQFFIPKTKENEGKLITDAEYRLFLEGRQIVGMSVAKATDVAFDKNRRFFHWFLEFPEIFTPSLAGEDGGVSKCGFDCILGNPPFLGGQKLTGTFGQSFLEYVKHAYAPAGSCDLVTYFFRRIFTIIRDKGFQALISTNTIAQGAAREGGLEVILSQGGTINFAVRSMKWPGLAAVEVALVNVYKSQWKKQFVLGNKVVKQITAYLDDAETTGNPYPLLQNANKSFMGSIVLGKGFILKPNEAMKLIEKDPKNRDVLFPYLNGEDLNTNPDQSPSRWVINFFDWPEEKCRKEYPDCFEIVEGMVRPEREREGNKMGREKWWQYYRRGVELYQTIAPLERVLIINNHTRHHVFSFYDKGIVYSHALSIITVEKFLGFSILNSTYSNDWAWKYGSTMGSTTLRYTPTAIFETFPFPQNLSSEDEANLEHIGEKYHNHRRHLMLAMQLGLTKTYNQFHNKQLSVINDELPEKEIEKNHGKETLNLWKHLRKTENTCPFNEAVGSIFELRRLHKEMDETVLKAYGWTDIDLAHDFYEVEYLPENDRIRYTISPDVRREILKRLLKLNHEIHAKEVSEAGHTTATKKTNKGKKINVHSKQIPLF